MAKVKSGFISIFLLVYGQYCWVVSQVVESGLSEVSKNGGIIYDISQLIGDSLEKETEDWAGDLLQNVLKEKEVNLHYETETEILDLSQLSNVVKIIEKIAFRSENPRIKLFISVRHSITCFKTPTSSDTTTSDLLKTPAQLVIIFPIDCGENSDLSNESSALISSLRSKGILVGFRHQTTSSCHPPKAMFTEADFLFNVANFTTQIGFPESYTLFQNHLQSRAEQNAQIKNLTSFNFHLRIDSFSKAIPLETDIEYNLLLLQFGTRWSEESGSSVIISFSSPAYFSKLGESKRKKRSVGRSSVIIPWLHYVPPLRQPTPTFLLADLVKISSLHQRIVFAHFDWRILADELDQLEPGQKLSQPLKATVWVEKNLEYLNKTVAQREKLRKRNVFLEHLAFGGSDLLSQKPSWFDSVIGEISVICSYIFGSSSIQPATAVQTMRENCGYLFDHAATLHGWFNIGYPEAAKANFSLEFYTSHVQQRLNEALLARTEIQAVKKNVNVQLFMFPVYFLSNDTTYNFYCNETLIRINAYEEAIGNWARINDFPVVLYNIFPAFAHESNKITWWSRVNVGDEVSQDITENNPVYVLRNFGDKSPEPSVNVDSCVKWSAEVPQEGIPFDKGLTGVTFPMNLQEEGLNINELETMLLFALHKFTTVELLPGKDVIGQLRDLKTLNALLDTDFLEAMVDFDSLGGRLYLEISLESTTFPQILVQVEKVAERISEGPEAGLHLMGEHLSNWDESESSTEAVVGQVVDLGRRYDFKVGLVVQNCATLLNKLATATSNNWTSVPPSDYILCSTKAFPAHNENKEEFAINLDTHLYMSKIFEKFLPGRAIYFRVNSCPCCVGDSEEKKTENLFRFLNDVSQFAVGNKLKHFLVQAFPPSSGTSLNSNWFQMENHADLSDVSVFTDREEVLKHNKSNWRPPSTSEREERRRQRENNTNDSSTGLSTETVLIVIAGVILVATIVITLVALYRYRKCITRPFCGAGNEGNLGGVPVSEYVTFKREGDAADEE